MDEAHEARNRGTKKFNALAAIRADILWKVTGTPWVDKPLDLFFVDLCVKLTPFPTDWWDTIASKTLAVIIDALAGLGEELQLQHRQSRASRKHPRAPHRLLLLKSLRASQRFRERWSTTPKSMLHMLHSCWCEHEEAAVLSGPVWVRWRSDGGPRGVRCVSEGVREESEGGPRGSDGGPMGSDVRPRVSERGPRGIRRGPTGVRRRPTSVLHVHRQ